MSRAQEEFEGLTPKRMVYGGFNVMVDAWALRAVKYLSRSSLSRTTACGGRGAETECSGSNERRKKQGLWY